MNKSSEIRECQKLNQDLLVKCDYTVMIVLYRFRSNILSAKNNIIKHKHNTKKAGSQIETSIKAGSLR